MAHQAYNVVNTLAHEISVFTMLYILLHSRAPHLVGMNGDVQSDLDTIALNNGEKLKIFIA